MTAGRCPQCGVVRVSLEWLTVKRLTYEWLDLDGDECRPSNAIAEINCPRCLKAIIWALSCDLATALEQVKGSREEAREYVMDGILFTLDRAEGPR